VLFVLCSLGSINPWTESLPCMLDIFHFVISAACCSKQHCCCSVVGVQGTVDYDEGVLNVPNRLVCCKVSFSTRFKLLIDYVYLHRNFQRLSCFSSAVNTVLCSFANL